MARPEAPTIELAGLPAGISKPFLETGNRVFWDEFERRYELMPHVKKAELIEGTVYMPSPARFRMHAEPHSQLGLWLGLYATETAGQVAPAYLIVDR